ncbi:hypothetical protein FRC17_003135 [Serendipita sp. 399]|nr:hypothetical protein FRC17_003135 [Serendipita sp. 399]
MPPLMQFLRHLFHRSKPQPVDNGDEVWLLDNVAFRPQPQQQQQQQQPQPQQQTVGRWRAEYVAAFFDDNHVVREKIVAAVADIMQILNIGPDDDVTEKRIEERVAPFVRQIGLHKIVNVQYEGDREVLELGSSGDNGISSTVLDIPLGVQTHPGEVRKMNVVRSQRESPDQHSDTAHLETGKTFFVEDGGWGVISDIDDTIKITEVRDRIKIIRNTFTKEAAPVPGMSDLYKQLHDVLSTQNNPAPFFYLSASPYNLYPFLREFVLKTGFPQGMIILRDMSWMALESFIVSLTYGTQTYKEDRMRKISTWLPKTKWICIGDSTQTDPEAYATFYKELAKAGNEGRVAHIWIHKVVGVNPSAEKDLNAPKRFEKAFKGIDSSVWKVFESASELNAELEALKKEVHPQGQPQPAASTHGGGWWRSWSHREQH